MIIQKINYEQLFPLPQPYSNVRLSIEIILEEGDTTADAFTRGHKEANENFNRLFPQVAQAITDYNTGEQSTSPSAAQAKEEADKEFEQFKIDADIFLLTNPTDEEITQWLKNNGWFFAVDAKTYIKSKQLK